MSDAIELDTRQSGARFGMPLSPRELEVLEQLSRGHSYADVADILEISLDTVKSHLKRVFVKLGARSGAHAVGIAFRRGLLGERGVA